jgi:hypothetical protein
MDSDVDYWIDEPTELEGDDAFRPGIRGIVVRLLLLVLLIWTLIQMVLPRRNLILQMGPPPNPPAEPIEPNYWL